jgi:hypothetical protein
VDHAIELQNWVGTHGTDSGIPAMALPAQPTRRPAPVRGDLAAAAPTAVRPRADYESRPQLAVLTTERDEPADWLRAGQALQRVLLVATVYGLSASFLYQPIELRDMRGSDAPEWPWREHPQMVIRLGHSTSAPVVSPRRPVEAVLTSQAGTARPGLN